MPILILRGDFVMPVTLNTTIFKHCSPYVMLYKLLSLCVIYIYRTCWEFQIIHVFFCVDRLGQFLLKVVSTDQGMTFLMNRKKDRLKWILSQICILILCCLWAKKIWSLFFINQIQLWRFNSFHKIPKSHLEKDIHQKRKVNTFKGLFLPIYL